MTNAKLGNFAQKIERIYSFSSYCIWLFNIILFIGRLSWGCSIVKVTGLNIIE